MDTLMFKSSKASLHELNDVVPCPMPSSRFPTGLKSTFGLAPLAFHHKLGACLRKTSCPPSARLAIHDFRLDEAEKFGPTSRDEAVA